MSISWCFPFSQFTVVGSSATTNDIRHGLVVRCRRQPS
jgi:hypothetical protein